MPGTYFTSKLCLDLTLVWMMMLSCITGLSVTLKWRRYKTKSRNDNYGWHGIRTKTIYTSIIPVSSKPWIASLCSPTPHQPWASATAPQDAQAWKHWGEYELKTQYFNCKRNSCQSGQLQTDPCGICLQCAPGVCSFFLASANFSTAICDIEKYSRTMRSSGLISWWGIFICLIFQYGETCGGFGNADGVCSGGLGCLVGGKSREKNHCWFEIFLDSLERQDIASGEKG